MSLVLHTERLVMRPLREDDLGLLIDLRTDPDVMKYIGELSTPEDLTSRLPLYCKRSDDGTLGMWSVVLKETDFPIGTSILVPLPQGLSHTRWEVNEHGQWLCDDIEVGYMLKPSAWGQGYATEITRRLLQHAFKTADLDEVVAVTDPENVASQNVLRKSGLVDAGQRHAYCRDLPCFAITKADWLAGQAA